MPEIITYRPCDNNIPISNAAFVRMCDQHAFVIISEILRKRIGDPVRVKSRFGDVFVNVLVRRIVYLIL